ncbi:hypothetical protein D3C86_1837390 [compost metagenome]
MAQTNRDADANLGFHGAGESRQRQGRGRLVGSFSAGEIEKGLIDGKGFDQRGQGIDVAPNLPADFDIFGHVGLDDHRVRAEFAGSIHGHG